MLAPDWLLATFVGGYEAYCDANIARQPNQVTGGAERTFFLLYFVFFPPPVVDLISNVVIYPRSSVSTIAT